MAKLPRWPRLIWLAYISKICFLLKRASSWKVMMISRSLRVTRFSGVRKKPRASCWVSVDPPQDI